jgi:hypothetical protein
MDHSLIYIYIYIYIYINSNKIKLYNSVLLVNLNGLFCSVSNFLKQKK